MIHRITANEYLRRFDNMTGQEKQTLMGRIRKWLDIAPRLLMPKANEPMARMQNVIQVSGGWNDAEQSLFNEGAKLLSAFTGVADTWLPEMLYTKAAKRSIRRMVEILTAHGSRLAVPPISTPAPMPTPSQLTTSIVTGAQTANTMAGETNMAAMHSVPVPPTESNRKRGRSKKNPLSDTAQDQTLPKNMAVMAVTEQQIAPCANLSTVYIKNIVPRPRHIDQYVHLLPEGTQQRTAQYGPLMRDLEAARENMLRLMNDKHSNGSERERWAKIAVKIDQQLAAIRNELDSEWNKVVATGRVIVDDLGMAHILDSDGKVNDPAPKVKVGTGKPKRSHHKQLSAEEKAKRITYLQKWLRDPRASVSEIHRKQWELNAHELLRLGVDLTEAMVKAGEHYGAKIPRRKVK